jgi:hypothetical protein
MKELTLTFTEDEYLVLAKMLNIAQWIVAIERGYDDFNTVNKIYNDVCKKGFYELRETKSFREMGELNYTPYDISEELEDETTVLTDLAEIAALQKHLPYSLAQRDFEEKYGTIEDEVILMNPELLEALKAIQKKYIDEFAKYGVTHLRLEEN